jgi:glycosyltransferase involved in cell wall biosynthesis
VKLAHVNYVFDPQLRTPRELLDRYHTLTEWSAAVASAGVSVTVVQAFTHDAELTRDGVHYRFRATGGPRSQRIGSMHAAILACNPDVVHVNGLDVPLQAWRLRRRLAPSSALVVPDHGTLPPAVRSPLATVRRALMSPVDGFLFTARAQARPWLDAGFIGHAALVHEVLEASTSFVPVARTAARASTGISGTPAVLWVGRLDDNKDPLTVLDAVDELMQVFPAATLTMIFSEDRLLSAVSARVTGSERLRRGVRLVGRVGRDRMAAFYSAADLFVLGSRRESTGYAVVEACACGLTPVVTGIPSFRTITGDGSVGRHWVAGDAATCAAALIAAARSDLERDRLRVRAHFEAHVSWSAVGSRARTIYERAIEERRAHGRPPPAC